MGENQGMIWIILGVLVVAAAVIFLGNAMGGATGDSADEITLKAATDFASCQAAELSDGGTGVAYQADGVTLATGDSDYAECKAA